VSGNFAKKRDKSLLVFFGFLSTDIPFTDESLPPFLALLLKVPALQVVDDANMVILLLVLIGADPLIGSPEMLRDWRAGPLNANHQQRVVD
jgi:hypothetical protein